MKNTRSKRRNRLRTAVVAGLMAAASLGTVPSALAESNPIIDNDYDQWWSQNTDLGVSDRCADWSYNHRFRFYYRPGYGGAFINIGHNLWDLKAVYRGDGAHPLTFCGGPSDGWGQEVANNSASAYNWYEGYCATVYYYKGYAGASSGLFDTFSPRSGHDLGRTRNNNRSIEFANCTAV
ncbi:hypothetical protein [Streptomyces sp. NPDC056944]|uniref:hypothetical protein n=1 Tax=unclassified Streptomyces TaxID=2593676 RepID=UPI00363BA889